MNYFILTDNSELDFDRIHHYIKNQSYWGMERTVKQTRTTIENCLCFGMYSETHEQLGFARIVTDYVFFGYIIDLINFDKYQGKGLGGKLISFMMNHEVVKRLHTIGLKTKDANSLYGKYWFKKIGDSPLWMANDKQKLL